MFTGIVETTGKVVSIETEGTNLHFQINSPISSELSEDQSLSHNGVCLTVTKVHGETHYVTAVEETLVKSNLGKLKPGSVVNLERSMPVSGRFDGHIVQGHVDQMGEVISIDEKDGSWLYRFKFSQEKSHLVVEKGSICINGVSLTCFDVKDNEFSVAIIPYTFEHTDFNTMKPGDKVNLEYDVIGKFVEKMLARD